jgi:hypothetical protein
MPIEILLVVALVAAVTTLTISVLSSKQKRHRYDNFRPVTRRTEATIRKEKWHQGIMYDIQQRRPDYNEGNFAPAIQKAYKAKLIGQETRMFAEKINKKGNHANHHFGPGFINEVNMQY